MDSVEIYRNSSIITMREVPSKIYSWVIILVISFIIFLTIALGFKYEKYLTYDAYVKNRYIEFYVDNSFFTRKTLDKVIIEEKEYRYKVISFEEYSYDMGEADYWKVVIEAELPNEWLIENNRITLNFLEKETTFAKSMINKIKKGLG